MEHRHEYTMRPTGVRWCGELVREMRCICGKTTDGETVVGTPDIPGSLFWRDN